MFEIVLAHEVSAGADGGDDASPGRLAPSRLPGRARKYDLLVTMDDATSALYPAFLTDEEGTASTFRGLGEVVQRHGLFCSLYTDRFSHYFLTPEAGVDFAEESWFKLTHIERKSMFFGDTACDISLAGATRRRARRIFGDIKLRW